MSRMKRNGVPAVEKNSKAANKYEKLFVSVSTRIVNDPKEKGELDAMYVSGTSTHIVGDYKYIHGKYTIINEERLGSSLDVEFEVHPKTSRAGYYTIERNGKKLYYNFHLMNDAFYCLSTHKDVFLWELEDDDKNHMIVLVIVDVNGDCGVLAPALDDDDDDAGIVIDCPSLEPKEENIIARIEDVIDAVFNPLEW